ncbi:MAG: peroxiredoxin family protein [Luteibaculum sp.]
MKNIVLAIGIGLLAFGLQAQNKKIGTRVGELAPEIKQKDPNGKEIALSDLRGKYVLIDFWASWCGPCRRENPNVVQAFEKYNKAKFRDGKGFEVFSVSLDRSKESWVKAIEQDQLDWPYHVSDLGYWNSAPAKTYGVNSIPSSYLIDPDGVIIAKNLRGPLLHMELDKYVKKL